MLVFAGQQSASGLENSVLWKLKVEKETVENAGSAGEIITDDGDKQIDCVVDGQGLVATVKDCYKFLYGEPTYLSWLKSFKFVNMFGSGEFQNVYFQKVENNVVYRYIWYREKSILEAFNKNSRLPISIYFGSGKLYEGDSEKYSESQVKADTPVFLKKMVDLKNSNALPGWLKVEDTQWYAFSLKRAGNYIYLNMVDKFLPSTVVQGQYEKYD